MKVSTLRLICENQQHALNIEEVECMEITVATMVSSDKGDESVNPPVDAERARFQQLRGLKSTGCGAYERVSSLPLNHHHLDLLLKPRYLRRPSVILKRPFTSQCTVSVFSCHYGYLQACCCSWHGIVDKGRN